VIFNDVFVRPVTVLFDLLAKHLVWTLLHLDTESIQVSMWWWTVVSCMMNRVAQATSCTRDESFSLRPMERQTHLQATVSLMLFCTPTSTACLLPSVTVCDPKW